MSTTTTKRKKRTTWSVTRIKDPRYPGLIVRVAELEGGGDLYVVRMVRGKPKAAKLYDPERGSIKRRDLGATEKEQQERARALGLEVIESLAKAPAIASHTTDPGEVITLGTLADLYEMHGLHGRSEKYRQEQPVKVRRLAKYLGEDRDVRSLCTTDVESFTAGRRGEGVRQGTIASDLDALKIALNWATEHKRSDGRHLVEINPLAKVQVEREQRPRRPRADEGRYLALRAVRDQVPAAFGLALDLVWATGRRIGAVLALRWEDVILDPAEAARLAHELDDETGWTPRHFPLGGIRWYAGKGTDNKKTEHVLPMNELARAALDRSRPDIIPTRAWIFPAPKDASKPLDYHVLKGWFEKAEEKAKLSHLKGGLWHPFRRGWATARKNIPSGDVAKAGGWRDEETMRRCYVKDDADTILREVNGG